MNFKYLKMNFKYYIIHFIILENTSDFLTFEIHFFNI